VFNAPPDVGGRYSALTEFGLVPAATIGVDLYRLRMSALETAGHCGSRVKPGDNPALALGAFLGELADAGIDKATFLTSRRYRPLVAWIEQLVAESTGKERRGIVPIGGDDNSVEFGPDRTFIVIDEPDDSLDEVADNLLADGRTLTRLTLDDPTDLGGAMFILEMAVAGAGAILEINPFNQSNVQLAKELARQAMAGDLDTSDVEQVDVGDPGLGDHLAEWLRGLVPPGYVGIHAYLPPTAATRSAFETARRSIRDGRGVATTFDFGPRFLHSTGQLHKGGPGGGRFLQVIDEPDTDVDVPETGFSFGRLINAQALGDHQALQDNGRSVLFVNLGGTGADGLSTLLEAIAAAAAAD
jgi:transaldolase/glucose-6-phosphate isomerase